MSANRDVFFILKILTIKQEDPVATVTELGVQTYLAHGDKRVRDAMRSYLTHTLRKPIANSKRPALV